MLWFVLFRIHSFHKYNFHCGFGDITTINKITVMISNCVFEKKKKTMMMIKRMMMTSTTKLTTITMMMVIEMMIMMVIIIKALIHIPIKGRDEPSDAQFLSFGKREDENESHQF